MTAAILFSLAELAIMVALHAPLRKEESDGRSRLTFAHGLGPDGLPRGFALPQEPAPLLLALLTPSRPIKPADAESHFERILDASGDWPRKRRPEEHESSSTAYVLSGSTAAQVDMETSRGGPELEAGGAFSRSSSAQLVQRIAEKFGPVYGVLVYVAK